VFTSCTRFIILSRVIHFLIFQRPECLLHLFIKLCKVCFNFSFTIFVRVLWKKEIHNYNDSLRASSQFWGISWKVDAREETPKRGAGGFCPMSGIVALIASFAPSGARVQVMLQGTQIKYMPDKGHVSIIIINTQGQITQMYFMRKDCLTWNHVAGCKFHLQIALCRLARKEGRFREGRLSFGHM